MNFKNVSIKLIASASLLLASVAFAGPAAYKTEYRYNIARQVTGVIKPDPDGTGPLKYGAVRNTYNPQGLLSKTEKGELSTWQNENVRPSNWGSNVFTVLSAVEYTYDIYGRKTSEVYTDGPGNIYHIKQYNHDHLGRVKCEMVRMASWLSSDPCSAEYNYGHHDRITRYDYDTRDNITKVQKAFDTNLQQTYSRTVFRNNRRESVFDANGNKTEYKYDGFGRLVKIIFPSKTSTGGVNTNDYQQFTYDNSDNLTSERKRNGSWINYQYDNLNQRSLKDLNGSSLDVRYYYNNLGLEKYIEYRHSGKGIQSTYNGFGELTSSTNELLDNVKLQYQYDNNGNRTRITHPDNIYFQYGYDGLNRLNTLKENTSTLLSISYQSNGNREQIKRVGSSPDTYTNYEWDGIDRISTISHNVNGSSYDVTYGFGYNRANQIRRHTIDNNNYVYIGNANKTGSYQVNGLNQYTKINGQTISHDSNGNLTNDGTYRYTFDTENRLKSVTGPKSASFNYDPRGRLVSANENGSTKYFLYDGDMLVAELNSSETVLKRYVGGSAVDELLVQYDSRNVGSSYRRYVHTDHQSSVIGLSNNSGNMISRFKYDAYGIPSSSNTSRFGYTGQLYFKDIGLYYYKARVYHPKLGRFLQTDPVGYEDQMNLYAYVGNDPINHTDPSGKFLNVLFGAALGGALDLGAQIYNQMNSGASLSDALTNADYGSVAVSAALGSVGAMGTQLVKGGVTGSIKIGKETVKLTSKTERAVVTVDGSSKAAAVGAIQAGRNDENLVEGAVIKVADTVTSPLPLGTIVKEGIEKVKNETSRCASNSDNPNGGRNC